MRSHGDEVWKQTAKLLRRRPGWVVEAMSTPGMPTFWCFARGASAELSVQVERGSIKVQPGGTDQVVVLGDVGELEAWLAANRPASLQEPKQRVIDKLRAGKLFTWG